MNEPESAAPAARAPGEAAPPTPPWRTARSAGVLLHPSCLPGTFPIGDLGPAAHAFLDWLAEAGMSRWQVLPLGPTGYGDSPYGCLSAFAGNPLLISPDQLVKDELLSGEGMGQVERLAQAATDFGAARALKDRLHREAWNRFRARASDELTLQWKSFRDGDWATAFGDSTTCPAGFEVSWLDDWCLFAAIRAGFAGREWTSWDADLRGREPGALARARRDLADEIEFRRFEQFLFHRQWFALRAAAAARGVALVGDLPIYVAPDSADVWAHPELFDLDPEGRPRAVAGVPPDYFSATGQLWGNPLYRWSALAATGYSWWVARLRHQLALTDLVRLDHFRGFVACWAVPAGSATAAAGSWSPGPGRDLFDAFAAALGRLPLIAEDLGEIDAPVHELRRVLGLPGTRVLQFGFDEPDSLHAPHRHTPDCVVYTGTHDNDTCRGWFEAAGQESRRRALAYLGAKEADLPWAMVRAALTSVAGIAIVPLQDLLGLGSEARMNVPGREHGNWTWRSPADALPQELARRIRALAEAAARVPRASD